jgi:hypothetical protein
VFTSFTSTPPCTLQTANQQQFSAIGKGEVKLDLPNGDSKSELHLKEVLYAPEASYMLILVGRLDKDASRRRSGMGIV